MYRAIWIFFGLCLVLLVGLWTQDLRKQIQGLQDQVRVLQKSLRDQQAENQKLYEQYMKEKSLVHSASDMSAQKVKDLRDELAAEQAKLQNDRKALEALLRSQKNRAGAGGSVQGHIDEDTAALARLNDQLKGLSSDSQTVNDRSKAYRNQVNYQQQQQWQDNQAQILQTKAAIQSLQADINAERKNRGDPNRASQLQAMGQQLADLRSQRAQQDLAAHNLKANARANSAAISQEVQSEQNEVRSDRRQVEQEIHKVTADKDHWQKVKNSQSKEGQAQDDRLHKAEQEVALESQKIQSLQKAIDAISVTAPAQGH